MQFKRGHLRYFVTVAEEGQVTRAAARLHMAQPALSQAIAQLERDLGVTLLHRHARGVTLTAAGERFYATAKRAVSADADAMHTAESLARATSATVAFGFLGAAPGLDSPALLEAFARLHPEVDIVYRELPFPSSATAAWLAEVDVAVCHRPPPDVAVWARPVRVEPRMLLAPERHALAARDEVSIAEVLDETFIGLHPSVDPAWAGFWSLDDHRGEPPRHVTPDGAASPQEVLAALGVRNALTTVPAAVAALIASVPSGLRAIPIPDAAPVQLMLVGHEDRRDAAVEALIRFAANANPRVPAGAEEARHDHGAHSRATTRTA